MGIDVKEARAGLILLDIRRVVMETLRSWGVGCEPGEVKDIIKDGPVVKLLIRREIEQRRGTEKAMAVQMDLKSRYGVSESLVEKVARGKR
jgi:hypothetical protein